VHPGRLIVNGVWTLPELKVLRDTEIVGDLIVRGTVTEYVDEILYGKATIIPSSAGADALVVRDVGDTEDRIRVREDGRISCLIFETEYWNMLGAYMISKATTQHISTRGVIDGSIVFKSHDGTAYVDCAKLVGGYLEIARGKLTGILNANGQYIDEIGRLSASAGGDLRINLLEGRGIIPWTDTCMNIGSPKRRAGSLFFAGSCIADSAEATDTETLRNSPRFIGRAAYWDGIASADRDASMFHRMLSTTPTSELVFQIDGTDILRVQDDGDLTIIGNICPASSGQGEIGTTALKWGSLRVSDVMVTRRDSGDYGGNFSTYTPPAGEEGRILVAEDTNATSPGRRLYVYSGGAWRYVDLT